MKKLIALACAVSALALTSGANADTFAVTLGGSVPGFCSLTNNGGSHYVSIAGLGAANGTIAGGSGSHTVNYSANTGCKFTLSSSHAALTGTGGNPQTIAYGAALVTGSSAPTTYVPASTSPYSVLDVGSAGIGVNPSGITPVTFGWNVPAQPTTVYAKDDYEDTITIALSTL